MGWYHPVIAEGEYFDSVRQASKKLHICSKYIKKRCNLKEYSNYYYTNYRIPENKYCPTCNIVKLLSEFYNNKNTRDLKGNECKKCSNNSSRKNKIKNSDYYKNYQLNRIYGLSLEEYNELFNKQEGKCAICETHQSELEKALVVDHNHVTGEIRGLLCSPCNLGIGNLKDSIDLLLKSISYLNRYKNE